MCRVSKQRPIFGVAGKEAGNLAELDDAVGPAPPGRSRYCSVEEMVMHRVSGGGRTSRCPVKVLVIDVGGTNVKVLVTGKRAPRKVRSPDNRRLSRNRIRPIPFRGYSTSDLGKHARGLHGRPGHIVLRATERLNRPVDPNSTN